MRPLDFSTAHGACAGKIGGCARAEPWTRAVGHVDAPHEAIQACRESGRGNGVAIYHLTVKNISRGDGRSIVAAAAYRAGETLPNEAEERLSQFGGRRDVRHAEIRTPEGAPDWCCDRARLWNAAEAAEKRKDARLAKEIEFAIPRELPMSLWVMVAREMADAFTARGHIVDFAIHDDGSGHNPHVHMLLTTRVLAGEAFGPKMREADARAFVKHVRAVWESIANGWLVKAGADASIDARSHAARGLADRPGAHRGPDPEARRARREAARNPGEPMRQDQLEARQELLADKTALERFPLLRAREDWPPESPEAPGGLSEPERAEYREFWREVLRRELGEPERPPESPPTPSALASTVERIKDAAADRAEVLFEKVQAKVEDLLSRESGSARERRESLEAAILKQELAQLRSAIAELRAENAQRREASAAFRAKYPTQSWEDYDRREDEFPVPGPDGRATAPQVQERAEDRMLRELEQPARNFPHPSRPEKQPEGPERRAAEDEVLRQAHSERAHDPNMAWIYDEPQAREEPEARRPYDAELDWLKDDLARQSDRSWEPERER